MSAPVRFEELAARHPERLDDLEAHARYVARANEAAERAGIMHAPTRGGTPDSVNLANDQTPFRSQGSRETCYAFAACAAMEAAYRRKYALTLDLSEQYAFHINKACELYPDYATNAVAHENNSSYWGFQGASGIIDKFARAALPEEAQAPYLDGPQMDQLRQDTPASGALDWDSSQEQLDAFEFLEGHVPTAARAQARFRVTGLQAVPGGSSPEQLESILASGREVAVDIPGHCFLLVGYDRPRRVFLVKNSWGENQLIEYSYDSQILGGRYVTDVDVEDAPPQKDAFWLGRWQMSHDGWRGELVIRRTTDFRNVQGNPTKLGDYYRDGNNYDVNGVAFQNGQGLRFWIADTTDRVQPGARVGQEFTAYVFSGDAANAGGKTSWSGTEYGVTLSRATPPGTYSQGFDASNWVGSWEMNHDGWRGRLEIGSVSPFSATYRTADGQVLGVSGSVDPGSAHILRMNIGFPENNQPFQLLGHTWANDVFSGVTEWSGMTFGVQGRRV